jgi:molybdate transport system permease protein
MIDLEDLVCRSFPRHKRTMRSAWRWKLLLEAIVALLLVLPPTVLGFYVLLALGPQSPLGRSYTALTGQLLPFSFQGLLIASVLYSLPFAVQPFTAAFASVDEELIHVTWTLGASRLGTFWHVVLPLARPGLCTGMVFSFAHTVGEFGVVLMVGGNIPGVTRTVPCQSTPTAQEAIVWRIQYRDD